MQIRAPLTKSQCKVSDTQVTVRPVGLLFWKTGIRRKSEEKNGGVTNLLSTSRLVTCKISKYHLLMFSFSVIADQRLSTTDIWSALCSRAESKDCKPWRRIWQGPNIHIDFTLNLNWKIRTLCNSMDCLRETYCVWHDKYTLAHQFFVQPPKLLPRYNISVCACVTTRLQVVSATPVQVICYL